MDPQEQDFTGLSIEERLGHKVWKARLSAYEELIKEFETSPSEDDEIFTRFDVNTVKSFTIDSNVVAQETGILCVSKYLEFGPTNNAVRLQKSGVVSSLCEKGLSSSRAGTKTKTNECLMLLIERVDGNQVVQDMMPFFKHRLPKLVSGVVNSIYQIIDNFGCKIINPNPIIEYLPGLFSHADRNVRNEATNLTLEIYKWLRDGLKTVLLDDLKPIQKKDLEKAFDKVADEIPKQKRLLKSQKEVEEEAPTEDVEMEDTEVKPDFDPYDLLQPTDVLNQIPGDFQQRISNPVWKERKEVLEEVHAILSKASKLNPQDDYLDIMRIFTKCMKDANMQVVQLASECTAFLAIGLRKGFKKYYSMILVPMLERNKEKKPSFTEAINKSLDTIFKATSLSDVLEGVLSTMTHKTPAIKIAAIDYLTRCLSDSDVAPNNNEIESIMGVSVKLLSESQEPIRQAASQLIGTLMKIVGERQLIRYLEKVDDNRRKKINKFFEEANVKASSKGSNPPPKSIKPIQSTKIAPPSTIPSKRLATSPAKRPEKPSLRGLTSRNLTTNESIPKFSQQPQLQPKPEVDNSLLKELEELESKNKQLQDSHKLQINEIEKLKNDNLSLSRKLQESQSNSNITINQKDAQISRLNNDKENLLLKIKDLEQTIEIMKLNNDGPKIKTERNSGDLSLRVNRLSIGKDNDFKENIEYKKEPSVDFDNDDNWKKAQEITNQLRARIEKMKARSRPNFT
ncbi:protein Stu2p [[Candida] jaroonii]|uniref:Protein Stu2p n=1 Tax=[Candida] jaroonii TaxID=467808 RepID=A0ACA9Y1E2_9ASCO|nr:protein Stu2p [[Candida] jaroonii]